jgi:uncharacterized LabA/DUF88 family protein
MPKVNLPAWKRKKQAKKRDNIYAFIDSQNLNVGTQRVGWKMDWKKFRQYLQDEQGVTEAFMFIGYMPEFEDLYMQMHEAGYKVVLKTTYDLTRPHPEMQPEDEAVKKQSDKKQDGKKSEEEEKHIKGNIDADLVLWAMKEIPNYDKAVLVSGDGDFYALIEYLEGQGKLKHIMTPNSHYSSLFNAFDDYVVRLDKLRNKLAYRDKRRRKQGSRGKNQNNKKS